VHPRGAGRDYAHDVMRRKAARQLDPTLHGGRIAVGCATVSIGGKPAARFGDEHTCPDSTDSVPHLGGPISSGSATVFIGGRHAARSGDEATCTGPVDRIADGCRNVYFGGGTYADLSALDEQIRDLDRRIAFEEATARSHRESAEIYDDLASGAPPRFQGPRTWWRGILEAGAAAGEGMDPYGEYAMAGAQMSRDRSLLRAREADARAADLRGERDQLVNRREALSSRE